MSATTKTPAEQLERARRAALIYSQTPRNQYSTELCDMLGESLRAALEQLDAVAVQPKQPIGYLDAHKAQALRDTEGRDVIVIAGVTSYRASKADVAIYTSPVQQPATLTDEQIDAIHFPGSTVSGVRQFARAALKLAAATTAQQPLSEDRLMRCIAEAGCLGTVKMSFESGPYDIDRPTLNATKLARAIERAHGITGESAQ